MLGHFVTGPGIGPKWACGWTKEDQISKNMSTTSLQQNIAMPLRSVFVGSILASGKTRTLPLALSFGPSRSLYVTNANVTFHGCGACLPQNWCQYCTINISIAHSSKGAAIGRFRELAGVTATASPGLELKYFRLYNSMGLRLRHTSVRLT